MFGSHLEYGLGIYTEKILVGLRTLEEKGCQGGGTREKLRGEGVQKANFPLIR